MMSSPSPTWNSYRSALETYFDRTARDAWVQLTSDAPVSRIRATVRAGRDGMRDTLLSWLPQDMRGLTLLDAGCGTGALAVEAARRGAHVVAVDVSGGLVDIARERAPSDLNGGSISWHVGDMLDPALGQFDHVVAMDSLIHYRASDIVDTVSTLASRTRGTMVFTFAPATPALNTLHAVGKLFPRKDRAPAIIPVGHDALRRRIAKDTRMTQWTAVRDQRISSGFYKSHALEVVRG